MGIIIARQRSLRHDSATAQHLATSSHTRYHLRNPPDLAPASSLSTSEPQMERCALRSGPWRKKITYRCCDCGWTSPIKVGQCRECGGMGLSTRQARSRAGSAPPRLPRRAARGDVDPGERASSFHGRWAKAGPGPRRRHRPRRGDLLTGEPGVGKVHAAAGRGRQKAARTAASGRGRPLRDGRGVGGAGAGARRDASGRSSRALLIADETNSASSWGTSGLGSSCSSSTPCR